MMGYMWSSKKSEHYMCFRPSEQFHQHPTLPALPAPYFCILIHMEPEQLKESLRTASAHRAQDIKNPQEIFTWSAPVRAYKRKSAGMLRFYVALALLLSVLMALFREFVLIFPIWAVMFLVYVLTITQPHETQHHLTKYGLIAHGQPVMWDDLYAFYFQKRLDYDVLVVLPRSPFALPIYMVVDSPKTKKYLMNHLVEHIIFMENPPRTFSDSMADWLGSIMPNEEVTRGESSKHEEQSPKPQTS